MNLQNGQRFERWTVIAFTRRHATCRCDCGTERDVLIQGLTNGRSRSCGCLAREVWAEVGRRKLKHPVNVGDRFGRLVVVDPSVREAVLCRCDCGKEKTTRAPSLYQGTTRSCGCLYLDSAREMGHANAGLSMNPGDRFGRLTVLDATKRSSVLCRCDCGNEHRALGNRLTSGHTKSCGCLKKQGSKLSHGLTGHALFPTWQGMWARCTKTTAAGYHNYGGRGIGVYEPWRDPAKFVADIEATIGPRPEGKTLDRIDNNGGYAPGNLRWSTQTEQIANRRNSLKRRVECPSCSHVFVVAEAKTASDMT